MAAALSYLAGCHHVSQRGLEEVAQALFDVPIAVGTVAHLQQEMSAALADAHAEALEAVRQARKNGAQVIALTNNPASRLAHEADAVLCATAEDSPLIGEHGAARVAQLALLDALFLAVAQIDPAATEAGLSRTMAALRPQRAPW